MSSPILKGSLLLANCIWYIVYSVEDMMQQLHVQKDEAFKVLRTSHFQCIYLFYCHLIATVVEKLFEYKKDASYHM